MFLVEKLQSNSSNIKIQLKELRLQEPTTLLKIFPKQEVVPVKTKIMFIFQNKQHQHGFPSSTTSQRQQLNQRQPSTKIRSSKTNPKTIQKQQLALIQAGAVVGELAIIEIKKHRLLPSAHWYSPHVPRHLRLPLRANKRGDHRRAEMCDDHRVGHQWDSNFCVMF